MQIKLVNVFKGLVMILEEYFLPLLILTIRLWMARIFLHAGLAQASGWSTTLALFKYEYQVPYLNPVLAAYLAMTTDLISPIFLVIGLFTRLSAFSMLIMTSVIQLTYLQLTEHYYWGMLLSTLVLFGPGKISIDHFIRKYYIEKNHLKLVKKNSDNRC